MTSPPNAAVLAFAFWNRAPQSRAVAQMVEENIREAFITNRIVIRIRNLPEYG